MHISPVSYRRLVLGGVRVERVQWKVGFFLNGCAREGGDRIVSV